MIIGKWCMLHDDKGIYNSYLQAKVIILAGYFPGGAHVIQGKRMKKNHRTLDSQS
jgi:hypothetical protein